MKNIQIAAGVLFLILLVMACAPKAAPSVVSNTTPTPQVAIASAREKWEEEWELLIRAAQKEGKVIVYMSIGGEFREALIRGFQPKYGISVEAVAGRDLIEKLQRERRAGIYTADVYRGGSTSMVNTMKPAGMLDPLEPALMLPEAIDPKVWWRGQLDWVDAERKIVALNAYPSAPVAINTELVKRDEIKSYRDLLNPKWKGKMIMDDPTIAGKGAKLALIADAIMGWDYLRELARQEPLILRDRRLLAEWVARGKYAILIQPDTGMTTEFINAGAPVAFLTPVEGSYLSGGSCFALINRAPHPNAAKLFINWVLTREGGTIISKATGDQSGRLDVPTDFLDPVTIRQSGMKYVNSYDEQSVLKEPEQQPKLKEIFEHLIK